MLTKKFMKRGLERQAAMRKAPELNYEDCNTVTLEPDSSSESEKDEASDSFVSFELTQPIETESCEKLKEHIQVHIPVSEAEEQFMRGFGECDKKQIRDESRQRGALEESFRADLSVRG